MAAPPAMPDDVVAQLSPLFWREQCGDCDLDLVWVGFGGPPKAPNETPEVGVHGDTRNAKSVTEYHVGGLAADARERHQILHTLRHFAAEALGQGGSKFDQGVGLGPKEARGLDQLLHFLTVGGGVRGGVGVAGEDYRRGAGDA